MFEIRDEAATTSAPSTAWAVRQEQAAPRERDRTAKRKRETGPLLRRLIMAITIYSRKQPVCPRPKTLRISLQKNGPDLPRKKWCFLQRQKICCATVTNWMGDF